MRPLSSSPCCLAVLLLLSSSLTAANHLAPRKEFLLWALNRSVARSNSGPMVAVINGDKSARAATLSLLRYFNRVGDSMQRVLREANYAQTALRSVCNSSDSVASTAIGFRMRTLGLGRWESDCITELRLGSVDELWRSIATMQDALQKQAQRLIQQTDIGSRWNEGAFTHYAFNYSGSLLDCEIRHVAAFRARGVWSVLGSLTSSPTNKRREDYGRHYLEEYFTDIGDGRLGNLPIRVNDSSLVRVNATTTESTWGGVPASSIFLEVARLGENPAIDAAMSTGSRFLEQAADSKTAANISIMVLSCVLALIPIALFADVGPLTALVYTVATDIVSCLPLAIKGVELIGLSAYNIAESSTRVYGLDSSLDLGVSEVWVARCSTKIALYKLGVAFLIVAIAAMLVGLVLEVYCRNRLKRMKEDLTIHQTAVTNAELKQLWAREMRCTECNCYAVQMNGEANLLSHMRSSGILSTRIRRRTVEDERDNEDSIQPAAY